MKHLTLILGYLRYCRANKNYRLCDSMYTKGLEVLRNTRFLIDLPMSHQNREKPSSGTASNGFLWSLCQGTF